MGTSVVETLSAALVIALLLFHVCPALGLERRRVARALIEPAKKCRNTAQGRDTVSDEEGMLCLRSDLQYPTGCCSMGRQYDCNRCTLADKCCSDFESCVSCCLKPQHDATALSKEVAKFSQLPHLGAWNNPFDYCMGVCRTHARSTMHENAYVSVRHHCFSQTRRPLLDNPLPPGALDGVEVLLGAVNDSCDTVCARKGRRCSERHAALLNSCDRLRDHAGCEAGCAATATAVAVPAYVAANAPKTHRPAMCFVAANPPPASCTTKEQYYMRLCACTA